MSTIVENLRKARALYAANPSHAPHASSPEPGTVCPIFALCDATEFRGRSYEDAVEVFGAATGTVDNASQSNYIAKWNAVHTTEEVLAGFDAAIAIAEFREQIETATVPEMAGHV